MTWKDGLLILAILVLVVALDLSPWGVALLMITSAIAAIALATYDIRRDRKEQRCENGGSSSDAS